MGLLVCPTPRELPLDGSLAGARQQIWSTDHASGPAPSEGACPNRFRSTLLPITRAGQVFCPTRTHFAKMGLPLPIRPSQEDTWRRSGEATPYDLALGLRSADLVRVHRIELHVSDTRFVRAVLTAHPRRGRTSLLAKK